MRQVVKYNPAGYSISICFFDPAGLPPDFDQRVLGVDLPDFIQDLVDKGRFVWQTPGETESLIHFYVDDDPPEWLSKKGEEWGEELVSMPVFHVPSGVIRICSLEDLAGAEVASAADSSRAGAKSTISGGRFDIPRGRYQVTSRQSKWSLKVIDRITRERMGFRRWRRLKTLGSLVFFLFVGLVIAALMLFIATLQGKVSWKAWAIYVGSWAIELGLMNVWARLDQDPAKKSAELEFPVIVVKMKTISE